MKWIKAKDKLPEEYRSIPIKIGNKYGYAFYAPDGLFHSNIGHIGKEHPQFQIGLVEWLDESELSFGLSDMRGLFNHFNNCFSSIAGVRFGDQLFTEYLKDKFNIDL